MKNQLLTFITFIICFTACKSSYRQNASETISFIGKEIKSYKSETRNYVDDEAFHISVLVVSKDLLPKQETIRVYDNRPLGRIKKVDGYDYIEYVLSSPIFELKTDDKGKLDLYFVSEKECKLVFSFGHIVIKPIIGKTLAITVFSGT
ncbi:hypothetical protein H2O64_10445 [Kordia sp. YSTF-M3]|uniref:Lipoprotein n=1 Tax=Kordia aestuariivivens TaxID=2759037 RepID=A0ABR7Q9J5_9FLAO|nr:hypothetical protein [Kordia aestuariivivens]MBC8755093.1 hypothetical protein [Kordia aestuariivivens]